MATAMTPFQAVLRRVVKHAKGRHLPDSSVYCLAEFQDDHPIGRTHYDDIISAVGAHWARVLRVQKLKSKIRVEFIFRRSPEDFAQALKEAQELEVCGLSRTVLRVALQTATDRYRASRKPARRTKATQERRAQRAS